MVLLLYQASHPLVYLIIKSADPRTDVIGLEIDAYELIVVDDGTAAEWPTTESNELSRGLVVCCHGKHLS